QVFADPRCSFMPSASDGDVPRMEAGQLTGTEGTGIEAIFAHSDARHSKLRRVIGPPFTVPAANKLRPRVIEVTHALVDAMEHSGPPADLFEDYAIQVPMTVICDMLGVPREEELLYREAARMLLSTTASGEEKRAQFMKLMQHLTPIIKEAQAHPGDNILGLL